MITYSCIYVSHHGTKGQKWGVRRFQNSDGSLTPEGREHYGVGDGVDTTNASVTGKNRQGAENDSKNTSKKTSNERNNSKNEQSTKKTLESKKKENDNKENIRNIKNVDNETLTKKIERLRLETQYIETKNKYIQEINKYSNNTKSKGRKIVDSLVNKVGDKAINALTNMAVAKISETLGINNKQNNNKQNNKAG